MFKDGLFQGKRILVTGDGTGLGKAMAEKFLQLGAGVVICDRRKGVCDETAEALMKAHGGTVVSYGVDIRDAAAVDAMAEAIVETGPLTGLVNNADNAAGNFISRTEDLSTRGFDAGANIVARHVLRARRRCVRHDRSTARREAQGCVGRFGQITEVSHRHGSLCLGALLGKMLA